MAVLTFSGTQVAFFAGIDSDGDDSSFTGVTAPFLATDVLEIVVPDVHIQPNGDFDPFDVQFTSVTVVRDGVRHSLQIVDGARIKETGGGPIPEAGDTFFTTNDEVGPAATGPFSGLPSGKMVFATDSTFEIGQVTRITRLQEQDLNADGDTADAGESASGQFNATPSLAAACFAEGTLIDTPQGPRPIQALRRGDLVITRDSGPQSVRWTGTWLQDLARAPQGARPVLLQPGALGPGVPERPLIVSPQHRILVGGGGQLQRFFAAEVFVPAKALTELPQVRHMAGRRMAVWHHFACARHQVIRANGCWSETLLAGPVVWRGLPRADLEALEAALSDRAAVGARAGRLAGALIRSQAGTAARPCLTLREAVGLIARGRLGQGRAA